MTSWDYPITTLYGWVQGYPLHTDPNDPAIPASDRAKYPGPGYGWHSGVDYGCPTGTEITVNGVVIGISGATGAVTGPHCHVGHWNGGTVLPIGPQDGKNVNGAKVTQVSEDSTNGKFVRVGDADGTSWVYLHMSDNSKVSVGQALQGADMVQTEEDNRQVFLAVVGRNPYSQEVGRYIGKEWLDALQDCEKNTDRKNIDTMIATYYTNGSKTPEILINLKG